MPLSDQQAVERVGKLRGVHMGERSQLDRIRRYWKGLQGLPLVIPQSAPREVREMGQRAKVNICDIAVETMAQSLFVDGFRGG